VANDVGVVDERVGQGGRGGHAVPGQELAFVPEVGPAFGIGIARIVFEVAFEFGAGFVDGEVTAEGFVGGHGAYGLVGFAKIVWKMLWRLKRRNELC